MKTEVLEALLIDRALGQLSPEVAALLAEHLAGHPEAAALASNWNETVSLATSALKKPERKLALPPRTFAVLPRYRMRRVAALAASFAAGVGVALLGLRSGPSRIETVATHPAAPAPKVVITAAPSVREAKVDPAIRTLPFWSTRRAIAVATMKQSTARDSQ